MLTLAIDCALRRVALGLSDGEKMLGELTCDVGTRQAELLPLAVANFLSLFGHTVRDIALVAVTEGPGYFTGIRVGMSYAAALAESVGARVVAVPTLLAMAYPLLGTFRSAGLSMTVATVIPAGKDSVYAAIYGCNDALAHGEASSDEISVSLEPSYIRMFDFMNIIRVFDAGRRPVLTGVGIPEELKSGGARIITPPPSMPSGILEAARSLTPIDPANIRAVYLREPG